MKPKAKEIIFDAFAVGFIWVGFSTHSWPSLCFLLVGIICASFALYVTLLNHRIHGIGKAEARNWSLLFFILFTLGASEYWRECKQQEQSAQLPTNPPASFSFSVFFAWETSDRMVWPEFWLIEDKTAFAVPLAFYAEFTNLKPIASKVNGYSVETCIDGSNWITMPSVDARFGHIVHVPNGGTNFEHAIVFDFPEDFNERICNANIPPGYAFKGWIFLSIPKTGWNEKMLRFHVLYSTGAEEVQLIDFVKPHLDTDFQQSTVIFKGYEDIRALPKKFWEDRANNGSETLILNPN